MPLSCSCSWDGGEPGQTCWYRADDFQKLETKRRKRCSSCGELISIGSFCLVFPKFKVPEGIFEINFYGEDGDIPRAPLYMCEKCGEIWMNLQALGFECVSPYEDMKEMLSEYIKEYNPPKMLNSKNCKKN